MLKTLSVASIFIALLFTSSNVARATMHRDFSAILKTHVRGGVVNYSKLKQDKRLDAYLKEMQSIVPHQLSGNDLMAFWINAYNAFTLKLICDNWPVKSIRDLEGGKVWDKKWIVVGSEKLSLNQIENEKIRPLGDPRIHYALVCAAKGCPILRSEAYEAATLDKQLTEQAQLFIQTGGGQHFDESKKTASISQLFKWYAKDFGSNEEQLLKHIAKFATSSVSKSINANPQAWKVNYVDYDWSINGK